MTPQSQASRSGARIGPSGEPVLLLDQDRARWDHVLIRRGLAALERAEELERAAALGGALGRRDPISPAAIDGRRAQRALPQASTALLPTGHEPFNEQPEMFLDHVVPFLCQHAAGQGDNHESG